MRTMMKVTVPIEAANKAANEGTIKPILQAAFEKLRPEATYFFPTEEGRTILFFFDLADSSDLPGIGEPFFQAMNARISFTPVMNAQDFQAGMARKDR